MSEILQKSPQLFDDQSFISESTVEEDAQYEQSEFPTRRFLRSNETNDGSPVIPVQSFAAFNLCKTEVKWSSGEAAIENGTDCSSQTLVDRSVVWSQSLFAPLTTESGQDDAVKRHTSETDSDITAREESLVSSSNVVGSAESEILFQPAPHKRPTTEVDTHCQMASAGTRKKTGVRKFKIPYLPTRVPNQLTDTAPAAEYAAINKGLWSDPSITVPAKHSGRPAVVFEMRQPGLCHSHEHIVQSASGIRAESSLPELKPAEVHLGPIIIPGVHEERLESGSRDIMGQNIGLSDTNPANIADASSTESGDCKPKPSTGSNSKATGNTVVRIKRANEHFASTLTTENAHSKLNNSGKGNITVQNVNPKMIIMVVQDFWELARKPMDLRRERLIIEGLRQIYQQAVLVGLETADKAFVTERLESVIRRLHKEQTDEKAAVAENLQQRKLSTSEKQAAKHQLQQLGQRCTELQKLVQIHQQFKRSATSTTLPTHVGSTNITQEVRNLAPHSRHVNENHQSATSANRDTVSSNAPCKVSDISRSGLILNILQTDEKSLAVNIERSSSLTKNAQPGHSSGDGHRHLQSTTVNTIEDALQPMSETGNFIYLLGKQGNDAQETYGNDDDDDLTQPPTDAEDLTQPPADTDDLTQLPADPEDLTQSPADAEDLTQLPVDAEDLTQPPADAKDLRQSPAKTKDCPAVYLAADATCDTVGNFGRVSVAGIRDPFTVYFVLPGADISGPVSPQSKTDQFTKEPKQPMTPATLPCKQTPASWNLMAKNQEHLKQDAETQLAEIACQSSEDVTQNSQSTGCSRQKDSEKGALSRYEEIDTGDGSSACRSVTDHSDEHSEILIGNLLGKQLPSTTLGCQGKTENTLTEGRKRNTVLSPRNNYDFVGLIGSKRLKLFDDSSSNEMKSGLVKETLYVKNKKLGTVPLNKTEKQNFKTLLTKFSQYSIMHMNTISPLLLTKTHSQTDDSMHSQRKATESSRHGSEDPAVGPEFNINEKAAATSGVLLDNRPSIEHRLQGGKLPAANDSSIVRAVDKSPTWNEKDGDRAWAPTACSLGECKATTTNSVDVEKASSWTSFPMEWPTAAKSGRDYPKSKGLGAEGKSIGSLHKFQDMVKSGLISPGKLNISIINSGAVMKASVMGNGRVEAPGGLTFPTPLHWFKAVTGTTRCTRLSAYKQIMYNGRSLADISTTPSSQQPMRPQTDQRSTVPAPGMMQEEPGSSGRLPAVQTDKKPPRVLAEPSAATKSSIPSQSEHNMQAAPQTHTNVTEPEVRWSAIFRSLNKLQLIENNEVASHEDFPELRQFWSADFTQMTLDAGVWDSVDHWD